MLGPPDLFVHFETSTQREITSYEQQQQYTDYWLFPIIHTPTQQELAHKHTFLSIHCGLSFLIYVFQVSCAT